jgi:single-strand selective monofunctional uracil DNA glycosylase
MKIKEIIDTLIRDLDSLQFAGPVTHVYNPLIYARNSHDLYFDRYGRAPKEVLFLGMNPGPFGMAQTGVPFGEVNAVMKWHGIKTPVKAPANIHPKRPVQGFSCPKSEVSGRRLWGWAEKRFGTPQRFFSRFFVANYCPLIFMEESGKNRTPDKLPKAEKERLFQICDRALSSLVELIRPRYVIGIGAFAEKRAKAALGQKDVVIGRITHPSPANPKANKGWEILIEGELSDMGIL